MVIDKKEKEKLFLKIDENKNSDKFPSQEEIDMLYNIIIYELGAMKAHNLFHKCGFYDHMNVDCKLDFNKWIYVDKNNLTGAGINSFHDVNWKMMYMLKENFLSLQSE